MSVVLPQPRQWWAATTAIAVVVLGAVLAVVFARGMLAVAFAHALMNGPLEATGSPGPPAPPPPR